MEDCNYTQIQTFNKINFNNYGWIKEISASLTKVLQEQITKLKLTQFVFNDIKYTV